MQKSKNIASLLVFALLLSMLAVFPAMYVSAADPIQLSNVEPAIPCNAGSEVTLSNYSVQLNDGTVLAPSDITWYNGETSVTKFTPSAAGVTKLTAKKTADGSISKTIYVVAKLSTDSDYTIYSTDFNSVSDIDGWNKIESGDSIYTVSNGKLTISGISGAVNPRIYLPTWLSDFGNYRIDVVGTQTDNTDASRWISMIYRAQNSGSTGSPYYHMCVRNNMSSAAAEKSGGVECCYNTGTWTYVKTASYTGSISPSKNYTFSVLAKGSTIQYQVNGDVVIHVDNLPLINSDASTLKGGIGLQANSSKFVVDSIKVSIQQSVPQKPVPPTPKIVNTRQPASNTLNHIANIGIVQSLAELQSYSSPTVNAPSTLIMYANGSNLTTENGTALCTVETLMQHADALTFIPAFYVKDTATVDKIITAAKAVGLRDLLFISNDDTIVKYAREQYSLARGAVDFSAMQGYTLSDDQLLNIRGTVRKSSSLIAILPANLALKSNVSELQAKEITVWVMDKSLNGDTEAAKLITSGATGIITDKFAQIETALTTLVEPNTLTKTPLVIGHRGNPTNAPENSISSYLLAIQNGADIVETDIYLTSDKQVVIMHDGTMERTTTGTGSVSNLTLAQIKEAHLWGDNDAFKSQYPDERVPTWEEMLQAVKPTNGKIFCEIKSGEASLVQSAVDLVKKYGMESRVSFISFNASQLLKLQQIMPTMTSGLLCNSPAASTNMTEALNSLDAQLGTIQSANSTFNPSAGNISEYFTDAAIDRGISIWPWTFSASSASSVVFNKYFLWGIEGLTTNDAQYSKDMVKYISSSKNAIVLSGNGVSSHFAVSSMTYGDAVTDITNSSDIIIKVLEGSDLITVNGGKVTAKAAQGTASFMVGYKTKTAEGSDYVLYTQPIAVTISATSGIKATSTSSYVIGDYIKGVRDNTSLTAILGNFQSPEKIVVLDANNNVVTSNSAVIGTGFKIQYVEGGNLLDENTVVIFGDINGDGTIDSVDALLEKKACIGNYTFSAVQMQAGCFSDPTTVPSSIDYLLLKKHILGNYDLFANIAK